jgi:hypothetical protein
MKLTENASFKLTLFEPDYSDDQSEDHDDSENETDKE